MTLVNLLAAIDYLLIQVASLEYWALSKEQTRSATLVPTCGYINGTHNAVLGGWKAGLTVHQETSCRKASKRPEDMAQRTRKYSVGLALLSFYLLKRDSMRASQKL